MPKITVLMPVYNSAETLGAALGSILTQKLGDFELLVIDDASTDATASVLAEYHDPRLRVIRNNTNLRIAGALNKGLALATGDYIARMDADDISLPDRFHAQAAFLDANPAVGIVGSWIEMFGDIIPYIHKTPATHDEIMALSFFANPLAHSSVMMRRSAVGHLRYSDQYPFAEDWEFWRRAGAVTQLANLQRVCIRYRVVAGLQKATAPDANRGKMALLRENMARLDMAESDFDLQLAISDHIVASAEHLARIETYLRRLGARNRELKAYPGAAFDRQLGAQWYMCCRSAWSRGLPGRRIFFKSPLWAYGGADWLHLAKVCLLAFLSWGGRPAKIWLHRLFSGP